MRRPPALAIGLPAVAALAASLLTLGGASASAASASAASTASTAHPASPAKPLPTVKWHRLSLRNSWVTMRTPAFQVANPSYTVYKGIVYLDGYLRQKAASTNREFAVLPKAARPAHNEFLLVATGTDTDVAGTVEIKSNGAMLAYRGSVRQLTTLGALSFPAASGGLTWHALTPGTGWAGNGLDGASKAEYAVQGGIVYLSGSLHGKSGQTASGTAAKLPYKDRPMAVLYLSLYTASGGEGSVEVTANGQIEPLNGNYTALAELDGISFPAAPNGLFSVLPKAAQTTNVISRLVYTFADTFGSLGIAQNLGLVSSSPFTQAEDYTSLAAYSYPRNS